MVYSSSLISRLRKISDPEQAASESKDTISKSTEKQPINVKQSGRVERCDFCSKPIPSDHKHFADLKNMKFMCACEMCAVLQAEKGEYQPLPERYLYLKDFDLPEEIWMQLKIPVNMAFIVYNSAREQPVAYYPSPAGATESELYLKFWSRLKQNNPVLGDMEADLEGFMINRLDQPHEHFIVPIDCCYKLIGLIRVTWQGMHGGKEMQNSVRQFFNELKEKAD
jgi:hypothetical protein